MLALKNTFTLSITYTCSRENNSSSFKSQISNCFLLHLFRKMTNILSVFPIQLYNNRENNYQTIYFSNKRIMQFMSYGECFLIITKNKIKIVLVSKTALWLKSKYSKYREPISLMCFKKVFMKLQYITELIVRLSNYL